MKTFSDTFKSALREDRQLNAIVSYKTDQTFMILTTQDDKNLLTETNDFLVTQQGFLEYDKEIINSVNPLYNVSLLKTTCKSVQIDSNNKIAKGTWVNVKIGVYKEDTQNYEYLDFGNYYVNEEPTYQADSNSYLITAYDKMIESMVNYDDNPLSITYPILHKNFIMAICNKLGWSYDLIDYPNYNKNVSKDLYTGQNLTYRDILDDLNGACGGSFMFNLENKLIWKRPTETNQIVEDNDLKDVNVDFGEKYGKVNVLTITTNGNVVLGSKQDETSIEENGKTEFNINDNYILNYSTEDFIDGLFNEINGLEYCLYDIDSTGLLIFEPLDIFTFRHNGVDYKTIMFNDDIKLTQGLVETTYAERPEETEKDYVTTDKDKNKLNNALISLNKANAEIKLKVNKGDVVNEINLSPEIVELKGNRVVIDSTNFKVDKNGNMNCNNATLNGSFTNYDTKGNPAIKIFNEKIQMYDYAGTGKVSGCLESIRGTTDDVVGINLYTIKGNKLVLGYQDNENDNIIHTIIKFETNDTKSTPWVINTADGKLFSENPAGGITVENGFIKNWSLQTTTADVILENKKLKFVNGLLVDIEYL